MDIFDTEGVEFGNDFDVEGVSLRELADELAGTDAEEKSFDLEDKALGDAMGIIVNTEDTLEEVVTAVKEHGEDLTSREFDSLALAVNALSGISNYGKTVETQTEDYSFDENREAMTSQLERTAEGFLSDLVGAVRRVARRVVRTISAGFKTLTVRQGKIAKLALKLETKMQSVGEGNVGSMTVKSPAVADWFKGPDDATFKAATYASARKEFGSISGAISSLAMSTDVYADITKLNKSLDDIVKSMGKIKGAETKSFKTGPAEGTGVAIPGKASGKLLTFSKTFLAVQVAIPATQVGIAAAGLGISVFKGMRLVEGAGIAKSAASAVAVTARGAVSGTLWKSAISNSVKSQIATVNTMARGAWAFAKAPLSSMGKLPGILMKAGQFAMTVEGATMIVAGAAIVAATYGIYRGIKWVMAKRLPTLSFSQINEISASLQEASGAISLRGLAGSLQAIEKKASSGKVAANFASPGQASAYVKSILTMTSGIWRFMTGIFKYSVSCSKAAYVYAVKSLKNHAKTGGREDVDNSALISDLDYVIEKLDPMPEGYDAEGNPIEA